MAANKLNPLIGDEFIAARKLTKLVLSHNFNIIRKNTPLVDAAELETLELVDCNITEFSDNTFENLSSLTALNLKENPLNQVNYKVYQSPVS